MPQPVRNTTGTKRHTEGLELNLEQVIKVIRRLDAAARSRVAQALAESEMDARFEQLILSLANKSPVDEISDGEIQAEINAVRRARLGSPCSESLLAELTRAH